MRRDPAIRTVGVSIDELQPKTVVIQLVVRGVDVADDTERVGSDETVRH